MMLQPQTSALIQPKGKDPRRKCCRKGLAAGEVPVFWACGVTSQTAIEAARLPLAITHSPGHMFVCDLQDRELVVSSPPAAGETAGVDSFSWALDNKSF